MKFWMFHLMPWPHLPQDFEEKYDTAWVTCPNTLFDPQRGPEVYHGYINQLVYADQLGFDGVVINEHHQNAYGIMPSPNLIAAALSQRVQKARVMVLGNGLPLYEVPIKIAEEFAMLDVLSGGRLVAGMPVGTPMDTCFAYGLDPRTLRDRYQEAHELIRASGVNYLGFVEGNNIFDGSVDVVVTDGFTGNVALKTMEGLAKLIVEQMRAEFTRDPLSKISGLLAGPVLRRVGVGLDPRRYNGACMVGLTGVVVKSHGSADAMAFAQAIATAAAAMRRGLPAAIANALAQAPSPDKAA